MHSTLPSSMALAAALALSACGTAAPVNAPAPVPATAPSPEPAASSTDPTAPAGFAAWLQTLAHDARAAGIRSATVDNALARVRWQPRVVELDRAQPEFTRTPWAYLDSAVSAQRIAQGQAQRAQHAAVLDAAAQRHGVPAPVITAIWGIESNYGANFGGFSTLDALATLAFDGRRRDWARTELLAALRIIDQGDIAADAMLGSWAGAMGHTQFLPSVFLAHAVDADGDGHRNIWGSMADVAASTANFLAHIGWRAGEPWGAEVRLPAGFDHAQAELTTRRSTTQWAADGVRAIDGGALPALESASILTPAGAHGPAFVVGPNFRALLRYNNSTNYALAVGLLARQIDGGAGVAAPWPRTLQALSREQIRSLQAALNARGFDTGTPDGVAGPATRAGLRRYQQSQGLVADGYPTLELLQRLQP